MCRGHCALIHNYSPLGSSGINDGSLKLSGYAALAGRSRKACRYVAQAVVIAGVSDNIIQSDSCNFRLRHFLKAGERGGNICSPQYVKKEVIAGFLQALWASEICLESLVVLG